MNQPPTTPGSVQPAMTKQETAENKMVRFHAFQRGFTNGAGMHPINEVQRAKHSAEYDAGFLAGKNAVRDAMKTKAIDLMILIPTIKEAAVLPQT